MNSNKRKIPVFFACDGNYLPYLAVTVRSIEEHASENNIYEIRVLTEGFGEKDTTKLTEMPLKHTTIEFVNVKHLVEDVRERIVASLRDYYSESIFYRIFIPKLFPKLKKAIYLDCDIVLMDDIAKLYDTDIGESILGAVPDEAVIATPQFVSYVDSVVGVKAEKYINSGVLLINCERFREEKIEEKIISLIEKYNFKTVAPDQDYLNFLCKDKIYYLDSGWNKQPRRVRGFAKKDLHLIHFNLFEKPWRYNGVLYEEEFWRVARQTPYFAHLASEYENYSDEERQRDIDGTFRLLDSTDEIRDAKCSFINVLTPEEVTLAVRESNA